METAVGEVQDHLLFPLAGRRPYPHQKEVSISTANETVKGVLSIYSSDISSVRPTGQLPNLQLGQKE
ncbi:hypothetical protein AAC387_Pa08g1972 [Persea americana]